MKQDLISSLFDTEERRPSTVAEINAEIANALERRFSSIWVEAEISNFSAAVSGHWYFTLSDSESQLRAACFKGANWRIRFQPFNGLQVRVRGRINIYPQRGEIQLNVESLEPVGDGAVKIAFEQVKARLHAEGLFDVGLKRPLPALPRRIGVVTSANGAAYHDIINVVKRRTRSVSIVLIPTVVQGETAPKQIRRAIDLANAFNREVSSAQRIDVLIVGRGGGSAEDLAAFNEEQLARTIRASEIPVISAVGHEIDFTIADLIADMRASTPSAAAEMVAEREEVLAMLLNVRVNDLEKFIIERLDEFRNRIGVAASDLSSILVESLELKRNELDSALGSLSPMHLASRTSKMSTRLAVLHERHRSLFKSLLEKKRENISTKMAQLDALSPLNVLRRGFSLTEKLNGTIIRETSQVVSGEKLKIRLSKGSLRAEVLG
ncbi:MAG: exodeoxyribonuclease VII large subunit, partial [Pyrinomonadaceae bacterium]